MANPVAPAAAAPEIKRSQALLALITFAIEQREVAIRSHGACAASDEELPKHGVSGPLHLDAVLEEPSKELRARQEEQEEAALPAKDSPRGDGDEESGVSATGPSGTEGYSEDISYYSYSPRHSGAADDAAAKTTAAVAAVDAAAGDGDHSEDKSYYSYSPPQSGAPDDEAYSYYSDDSGEAVDAPATTAASVATASAAAAEGATACDDDSRDPDSAETTSGERAVRFDSHPATQRGLALLERARTTLAARATAEAPTAAVPAATTDGSGVWDVWVERRERRQTEALEAAAGSSAAQLAETEAPDARGSRRLTSVRSECAARISSSSERVRCQRCHFDPLRTSRASAPSSDHRRRGTQHRHEDVVAVRGSVTCTA